MEDLCKNLFIYGYVLPLLVMLEWTAWCCFSDRKKGKKFVSYYMRDYWKLLVPGVSLMGTLFLLEMMMIEADVWLEGHWGLWSRERERSRHLMRWLYDNMRKE